MNDDLKKWNKDYNRLVAWVRAEQERDETRQPDIRSAADHLGISQKRVHDLAQDAEADGMIINVALGASGGFREFEHIGDYLLEI
jgi:hypothetical protein